MSNLILLRHSNPKLLPETSPDQWHLSDEGIARCQLLVDQLIPYRITKIFTSFEAKAQETGQFISCYLRVPCQSFPGLHEHIRREGKVFSIELFETKIKQYFEQPGECVFGEETAEQVYLRFFQSINSLSQKSPDQSIAIVTHGTAMTSFLSKKCGIEPFSFWKQLSLPAFVVLSRPGYNLVHVSNIGGSLHQIKNG
jgi:broad specificity phosphatase PhoE